MMLKTTSLGRYWQDSSDKSSFTRVRCISTGGQATPRIYGSIKFNKGRAFSVPDTSCSSKKLLRLRKKNSVPFGSPVLIDRPPVADRRENGPPHESYSSNSSASNSDQNLSELEGTRLLVCTLDTEQNERNLEEDGDSMGRRSHSRNSSVEMMTARSIVNPSSPTSPTSPTTQSCCACGNCLAYTDMVVMFDADTYHLSCFVCGQCKRQVDPALNFLVLEDGSPLCSECSPVCHACQERILSGHVNVLNKDFHESCLKCSICKKAFRLITKVYATGGEPCCAECVTPVFSEAWSPRGSVKPPPCASQLSSCDEEDEEEEREMASESSQSSQASQSNGAGVSAGGNFTLPPRLESLSKAVSDLPDSRFHSLLRPSFSVPTALSESPNTTRRRPTSARGSQLSLSSLKAIIYDELGVSLLMNFCVEDCSIEFVIFWLDAEQFRHFDGSDDDIKLFAHHIMLKYIGYYAELPINLPKEMEDKIVASMQEKGVSQDLFVEAQEWLLNKMEKEMQPKFLCSSDGQKYLEALVSRDIKRREKKRELQSQTLKSMKATVTSFDKRHSHTKYYIYEIQVEDGDRKHMIYRRYSDFHSLHQALRCTFPDAKSLPGMPKKIYFGRSQTRNVAEQRMKDLQSYLQSVLRLPFEISHCGILRKFLYQSTTDKEDETFNSRIKNNPS